MKKLAPYLVALALAAPLTASYALAQPPTGDQHGHHGRHGHGRHRDPAAHAEHRARMLTAILDLDAHQAQEVRRILGRAATEMQTLRQRERSEARRTQMRAIHERAKAEIDALLNPTQRATMDRMEAAREAEHARREQSRGQRP